MGKLHSNEIWTYCLMVMNVALGCTENRNNFIIKSSRNTNVRAYLFS